MRKSRSRRFRGPAAGLACVLATGLVAAAPAGAGDSAASSFRPVPGIGGITATGTGQGSAAFAVAARIFLSRRTGPPTTRMTVRGAGFGASQRVDVFFGRRELALAHTRPGGRFGPVRIAVPASALPGRHWISAKSRRSGRFAQRGLLVRTNWATFHFSNGRTGSNPYENVLNPGNVSRLHLDWHFPIRYGLHSSPAVVNGVVYIGSYYHVYALNAATGAKRWSFRIRNGYDYSSSPAVANGVVFVCSYDRLYALNAATGAKLWSANAIGVSPAVANGVVYIGSEAGHTMYVNALNAATGAKLWSSPIGSFLETSPAVANGVVYVGGGSPQAPVVDALDAATGAKLWSSPMEGFVETAPAVADGIVYVGEADNHGTSGGNVYALNAATGTKLWTFTTGKYVYSTPAVANGVVYVGSNDGNLYTLNAATGAKLWKFSTGRQVETSPAVANGVVYVGSQNGHQYALNAATGAKLWSSRKGYYASTSPAVANGVVYTGSNKYRQRNVYAFHLASRHATPTRPSLASLHPDYRLQITR